MTRREIAMQHFKSGCNCAQAVLLTFRDLTGLDEHTSLRLAAPFGGGIGRQREVCGAVTGMCLVVGFLAGYDDLADPAKKAAHYHTVQELCAQFKSRSGGSMICRELLGLDGAGRDTAPTPEARTETYYKKRPCAELVGDAAEILEELIKGL